jgi:hypothetical protein
MGWTDEIKNELDRSPDRQPIIVASASQPATLRPSPHIGGCSFLSLLMLLIATILAFAKGWQESVTIYWACACVFSILGFLADMKKGCLAMLFLVVWIFYGFGMVMMLFSVFLFP